MRLWFTTLFLFLSNLAAFAQLPEPFPDGPPVIFTFAETYKDTVVPDPDFEGEFLIVPRSTLIIDGQAPLTAAAVAEIDENSPYLISVGDFEISGTLGEDETFSPELGDQSVNIILEGFDENNDFVQIGSIGISWQNSRVNFHVSITDAPFDYWVASAEYYPDINENPINTDNMLAALGFGPFGFDTRTVYMRGTAKAEPDDQERVLDNLSTVNLEGSIDSSAPTLVVTQPAAGVTSVTMGDVTPDLRYTFLGSASDIRKIESTVFPGTISSVEVRVGTLKLDQDPDPIWYPGQVQPSGDWAIPNVPLEPGLNRFTVRVTDGDGNVTATTERNLTLRGVVGDLTIIGVAEGYPVNATGKAGTVSGTFFSASAKKFDVFISEGPSQDMRSGVEAGQDFRVIATPALGSVFDGWVGTVNGVETFASASETLEFSTRPNLVVTAKFAPNPFGLVVGTYQGLVTGDTPAERGRIKISIAKTGSFSGKVQFGALSFSIRGKVLGSGTWTGTVARKGVTYTISFDLNTGAGEDRQLIGSVTGGGLESEISADLKDWRKPNPRKNDPGRTADAYVGTYNVLLPPSADNTDTDFPVGIGYGQVKITSLGSVTFKGKLGDGSVAKASATLVKRTNGEVFFPLFIALDGKLGSISGVVTYDNTLPDSDLTGTIEWAEPPTKGVEPFAFSGQTDLHGSLYVPPAASEHIMLQTANGAGVVREVAVAYSKPTTPTGTPLFSTQFATLNASTQTVVPDPPLGADLVKLQFKTSTGFFTGTFKDTSMSGKILKLAGIVSRKANGGEGEAGGVFIRGNRAGAISFGPADQ